MTEQAVAIPEAMDVAASAADIRAQRIHRTKVGMWLGVPALVAACSLTSYVQAYDFNHPGVPEGAITSGSLTPDTPPVSPSALTPSESSSVTNSPTASPEKVDINKVPLGTPLSYTLHMKNGGDRYYPLTALSCPPVSCRTETATSVSIKIKPPEPANPSKDHTNPIWKKVYYFDEDPRLLFAHHTQYTDFGDYFSGQDYDKLEDGDTVTEQTSSGTFTYKVSWKKVLTKDNGLLLWNQAAHDLTEGQSLATTCDGDNFNTIVLLQRDGFVPKPLPSAKASPTDIFLPPHRS